VMAGHQGERTQPATTSGKGGSTVVSKPRTHAVGKLLPFTPLLNEVMNLLCDMSESQFATYALLCFHANMKRGDGRVWPTQATLAREQGVSVSKIKRNLAVLERLGLITNTGQVRGASCEYIVHGLVNGATSATVIPIPRARRSRSNSVAHDVYVTPSRQFTSERPHPSRSLTRELPHPSRSLTRELPIEQDETVELDETRERDELASESEHVFVPEDDLGRVSDATEATPLFSGIKKDDDEADAALMAERGNPYWQEHDRAREFETVFARYPDPGDRLAVMRAWRERISDWDDLMDAWLQERGEFWAILDAWKEHVAPDPMPSLVDYLDSEQWSLYPEDWFDGDNDAEPLPEPAQEEITT
jgi:Helix-turn-helix domain